MAVIAFPRSGHVSLTASVRRYITRHRLSEQERHNLHLARGRSAVYTASLGGHPFHA
ncbi:hypothetical protein ACIRRA_03580 [Nocardia sp. NPDC101769]|uniref:hypothetical protein n=1 Tax=Nocardia sp. NPDC101769 TaxID=3364333 RepID=UPI0038111FCF